MGGVLAYADKVAQACELVTRGRELAEDLGGEVAVASLWGEGNAEVYFRCGARRVLGLQKPLAPETAVEVVAEALALMTRSTGAKLILISSSKRGKELAPRLAQKLTAGCITDALAVRVQEGRIEAERYALGGSTVATEVLGGEIFVVAVLPGKYSSHEDFPASGETTLLEFTPPSSPLRVVERRPKAMEGVNLEEASRVVAFGRGVKKKEDLALVEDLARSAQAEVGCTRPVATDLQWLPEYRMIGLSGKRVKPEIYFAVGLSGQIQHSVAIQGAKVIVAINSSKDAPIFKYADYGIIGDLYKVLPKLSERLRALKG
ncbi:MAG: electron transfer flavoprotein subunit alpha/FixB family protein [Candidatus Tectomicrobia bacterium]|uniref:Electron transfer flavoprotein subunit alpha/FixB family protein n=1 Tax=Tectimicrobiota bacterium TaxID=2528274 RepID=A0A932GRY2_UNCTE|nr:electron transfer flavoprotein subunit alpha/FixB family protein [Candidatus Tectomicrobia bacterium]